MARVLGYGVGNTNGARNFAGKVEVAETSVAFAVIDQSSPRYAVTDQAAVRYDVRDQSH